MINKKNTNEETKTTQAKAATYGYYSKLLKQPFDSVAELQEAEAKYYAEIKAKEDKVAAKKADAIKVEDAFKALNAARKDYKEKLTQLTKEYSEALINLQKAFETGKTDIRNTLAAAEDTYSSALKEFTAKHPEGYHVTLRDGDFETTISSSRTADPKKVDSNLFNIFDLLFNI